MFEKDQKSRVFLMFLRLYLAQTSQPHGFLSLLLLEDYINTSIHTYPGFARRINNVVQRMRVKTYVPCRGKSLSEVST